MRTISAEADLATGYQALARGDWSGAAEAFGHARRGVQGHRAHRHNGSAEPAEVFRVCGAGFAGYWCLANVAGLMRQLTEDVAAAPAAR